MLKSNLCIIAIHTLHVKVTIPIPNTGTAAAPNKEKGNKQHTSR